MSRLLYSGGKSTQYIVKRRLGGLRWQAELYGQGKILLCYWESNLYPLVALDKWWRRWVWTVQSFIMWHRVVWWKVTYISSEGTASIIRVEEVPFSSARSVNVMQVTWRRVLEGFDSCHCVLAIHSCNCPYKALTDWFLGAFAKLWETTTSFVVSVCLSEFPHGTTRLTLDGFSWNLLHEHFMKIHRQDSSFEKILQE